MNTSAMLYQVDLFGYPRLRQGEREVPLESAKVRALLVYLLHHADTPQARDYLAYLLWPDLPNDTARKNLRQALYSLRKALGPVAAECLDIDRDTVRLRRHSQIQVDTWDFDRLDAEVRKHTHRAYGVCPYCHTRYVTLLALYQDEFLRGFTARKADPFEDWAMEQREHYRQRILHAVHQVVRHDYLRGEYAQAEQRARAWLRWDPWSEAAYAYLIRSLTLQGRKGAALQAYHDYTRMMRTELNAEPPPDAEQLIYDVRHGLLSAPESVRSRVFLPRPLFPLVGRRRERDALMERLARPDTRLLTLVGPGGIGKTRLAQDLAYALLTLFPDGVYWVSLEGATSAEAAFTALHAHLQPALQCAPEADAMLQALAPRRALLVLDDVHVDNTQLLAWVTDLLRRGREITILVTARQPLHLRAEYRFPLEGLAYPQPKDEPLTPARAQDFPAVRLFVSRAQQLQPRFALNETTLACVLSIVRFTQGLPLALELAAAQTAYMACEQVAQNLRAAALDIQSPYHDQPAHHRSLRVLLERSWEGLPEHLKEALMQVAGFSAAFDTEMAQAVAKVADDDLQALARHSLLQRHDDPDTGAARWEMAPLVRSFAREQRDALRPDAGAAWEGRAWAWLQAQLAGLRLEHSQAIARLGALRPELRALMDALAENGSLTDIAGVLAGLVAWFRHNGRLEEGARFVERIHARVAAEQPSSEREALLGLAARLRGVLAYLVNDLETAEASFNQALQHLQAAEREGVEYARALQGLAGVFQLGGQLEEAERLESEALARYQAIIANQPSDAHEYWIDLANTRNNLGGIAFYRGDMAAAQKQFQEAARLYRQYGAPVFLVNTLSNLAYVLLSEEHVAEAQKVAEEALRLAQSLGAQRTLANVLGTLGTIAIHREDLSTALWRLRRAVHIAQRANLPELTTTFRTNLGIVFKQLDRPAKAEEHFAEAVREARAHDLRYNECSALIFYADFLLDNGRLDDAEKYLQDAARLAMEHHFAGQRDKTLVYTAKLWHSRGQHAQAWALLRWLKTQALVGNDRTAVEDWLQQWYRRPTQAVRQQTAAWPEDMRSEDWLQHLLD